jgi:VanZ family protein
VTWRVRAWAPAVVWAAVLFLFSSRPTLPTDLGGGLDKVAHFGAYAVLGLLLAQGALTSRLAWGWPVLLGLAYAASDEIHQHFVPGRSPDVADWAADALGVAAGCLFLYRVRGGRPRSGSASANVPVDSAHR